MDFWVALLLLGCSVYCTGLQNFVIVNLKNPVNTVHDAYLSVTIDSRSIKEDWAGCNFSAQRMITLAKGLAPAYLRLGGTDEDYLIFSPFGDKTTKRTTLRDPVGDVHINFTMSGSQWDAVNQFVNTVGWKLVFGLNEAMRDPWPHGEWDSTNAELLIDYTMKKGYQIAWELGNEPGLFHKEFPLYNISITPQEIVNGFKMLKDLLIKKGYPNITIIGPDVTSPGINGDLFRGFLKELQYSPNLLNAVTWHHYYGNSEYTPLSDFTSVKELDSFLSQVADVLLLTSIYSYTGDLWLGETSSTYGGGAALLSSSFVSGFMWLDKLGIAAYHHKKVFRQDFVGRNYCLLDENAYPLPDYWLSALYKRLVGIQVLNVEGALERGRQVRVYAHCAKSPYPKGSVVLIILNTIDNETIITLTNNELINSDQDIYWLTPSPVTNITSQVVALNGKPIELIYETELPVLKPNVLLPSTKIHLLPRSFGFVVFKNAKAIACL